MTVANFLYRIFFDAFATTLRLRAGLHASQVWFRNGLSFGLISWAKSDIDVSICLEDRANTIGNSLILRKVERVKFWFPLVREINVIYKSDLCWLEPLYNPVELKRDPQLRQWLSTTAASPEQRLVFLLRMLEAVPVSRLTGRLEAHEVRKWRNYCALAELEGRSLSASSSWWTDLIDEIENCGIADFSGRLQNYFDLRARHSWHEILDHLPLNFCVAYFPHRFAFAPTENLALTKRDLSIFNSQIQWEICGLTLQEPWLHERKGVLTHIEHIANWAEALRADDLRSPLNLLHRIFT